MNTSYSQEITDVSIYVKALCSGKVHEKSMLNVFEKFERIKEEIDNEFLMLECAKCRLYEKYYMLCKNHLVDLKNDDDDGEYDSEEEMDNTNECECELIYANVMLSVLNDITKNKLEQMKKKMILIKSHQIPKDLIRYTISKYIS